MQELGWSLLLMYRIHAGVWLCRCFTNNDVFKSHVVMQVCTIQICSACIAKKSHLLLNAKCTKDMLLLLCSQVHEVPKLFFMSIWALICIFPEFVPSPLQNFGVRNFSRDFEHSWCRHTVQAGKCLLDLMP